MLLALDIGNSAINIGFFIDEQLYIQTLTTYPLRSHEKYASILSEFFPEIFVERAALGVIISSVVGGHTEVLADACKRFMPEDLIILTHKTTTGLAFDIPRPEELGTDRIANAVAAYEICKHPVAALDFGTATTISVVGKNANYLGGAIMPGVGLMNECLGRGTSKLPVVSLSPPESALGADTSECIQSGLFYGTAGAAERLLQEIEKEIGFGLKVVATGGYAGMVSRFLSREHILDKNLTLKGLKIIFMRNKIA
jgi:type III pantothenate kinase